MSKNNNKMCFLRWSNHQNTIIDNFGSLLDNRNFVDCTLAAEGKTLQAHKVVLTACSPYFASLLTSNLFGDKHPVFILQNIKFHELQALIDFMYRGHTSILYEDLPGLCKAAETLKVKGLLHLKNTLSGQNRLVFNIEKEIDNINENLQPPPNETYKKINIRNNNIRKSSKLLSTKTIKSHDESSIHCNEEEIEEIEEISENEHPTQTIKNFKNNDETSAQSSIHDLVEFADVNNIDSTENSENTFKLNEIPIDVLTNEESLTSQPSSKKRKFIAFRSEAITPTFVTNELSEIKQKNVLNLNDESNGSNQRFPLSSTEGEDIERKFTCKECNKSYRWKSTLLRHKKVECGGKEPCHNCPYCPYKAKQRGNLNVHIRKHHPEKPKLESSRIKIN